VAGLVLEPFPKQVYIGYGPVGNPPAVYDSRVYEATGWKEVTYWAELYGRFGLGVVPTPVTAFFRTSDDVLGPWIDLVPGGETPAIGAVIINSVSTGFGRYMRFVLEVTAGEITVVSLRVVARMVE